MKDYIEVNSGIALALQGLGDGLKGMNFRKETFKDKLPEWLTMDVGGGSKQKKSKFNFNLSFDLKGELTALEHTLIRFASAILILILVYSGMSIYLNSSMSKKLDEISKATNDANSQITSINNDTNKIKANTSRYISMTERLNNLNAELEERNKRKNAIPVLLNQIMFSIPKGVQITSIENTSGTKIVINAQANTYDQLGYLKAGIKNYNILTNVISDSGEKKTQDGPITTTIEGDLPI